MIFFNYRKHTNQIFSKLNVLKLPNVIYFRNAIFVYDYFYSNLTQLVVYLGPVVQSPISANPGLTP